jgi:hypothetical protein
MILANFVVFRELFDVAFLNRVANLLKRRTCAPEDYIITEEKI